MVSKYLIIQVARKAFEVLDHIPHRAQTTQNDAFSISNTPETPYLAGAVLQSLKALKNPPFEIFQVKMH